jgi:hypothetical protein
MNSDDLQNLFRLGDEFCEFPISPEERCRECFSGRARKVITRVIFWPEKHPASRKLHLQHRSMIRQFPSDLINDPQDISEE